MRRPGVLLLHGTLGAPQEFSTLALALQEAGYTVRAISLPGHGDLRHQRLSGITADVILDHCRQHAEALIADCGEVVLVGHSLGGMCALLTAASLPNGVCGVAAFSTPLDRAYTVNHTAGLLRVPPRRLVPGIRYFPAYRTGLPRPKLWPWDLPLLHREAMLLFGRMRSDLSRIQVPVLLGHAEADLVVPYGEMGRIAERLPHPDRVICHTFTQSGHQLFPASADAAEATALILDFLAQPVPVAHTN